MYLNARHREGLSKLALENTVSAASWDDPNTFRGHEGVQVVLRGIRRIDLRPPAPVKGLVEGVLEPVVTLLGDAVFMALAAIDAGGVEGTGSSNRIRAAPFETARA